MLSWELLLDNAASYTSLDEKCTPGWQEVAQDRRWCPM